MHPDYVGPDTQLIADIAVVRTIISFIYTNNVRPITLGTTQTIGANERVTISGWGLLGNNERTDMAENLHSLDMMTISNNACSAMHQNTFVRGWITNEKLCTVPTGAGSTGICAGDRFVDIFQLINELIKSTLISGSPLVFRGSVIGVASWTVRPCANNPSVFIRTANHLEWIRTNL